MTHPRSPSKIERYLALLLRAEGLVLLLAFRAAILPFGGMTAIHRCRKRPISVADDTSMIEPGEGDEA